MLSRVRTASSNSAANNSNSNTSNSTNLNTVSDIEIGGASPDAEAAVPLVSFGSSRRDNDDSSGNLDPSASLAARSKAYLMHRRFYWGGSAPSLYLALKSPSLLLSLLALLLMLVVAVSIDLSSSAARASVSQAGESTESNTTTSEHLPLFDFDALASGQFGPQWASREWLAGAPDGSYLVTDSDGNLVVHHVDSRNTTVFVDSGDLYLDHVPLQYSKYIVSPTLQHVLFVANIEPVWRHSFYATYYLFDVNKRTLRPVVATTSMPPAPAVTPTSVPLPIDDTTSVDNRLALAVWSPTGETIAIVSRAHNIHVVSTASATTDSQVQLTFDGSVGDAVRNGVADWVYEEEVFSGSSCLWFSPLGTRLAYLKFVDTGVAAFKVQKYFSGGGDSSKPSSNAGVEQQYPSEIVIRYPKAGTANPVATLHIAMPSATSAAARDVEVAFSPADSMFPDDDRLFVEVNWVSEDALLVRMMNRVQDQQLLYLVQSPKETSSDGNGTSANSATGEIWTGTLVRNEKSSDGAWLMSNVEFPLLVLLQPIHVLRPTATAMASTKTFKPSPSESANPLSAYIELAEDETGNAHIAYYPYPTAKTPAKWLTRGADHEVTQIVHVDADRGVVFYLATAGVDGKAVPRAAVPPLQSTKNLGSIQRHLYSVKIEGGNFVKLSPPDGVTWKAAVPMWNFSNDDKSPVDADTPVGSVGWFDASFSAGALNWPFKKNDPIYDKLKNTAMPKIQYTTIPLKSVPGVELNSVITVPSTFDPKNTTMKYPLLISVYGGPNSQTVKMTYGYGFESALSNTGYIILHVDARGTFCKGRAFRSVVSKHLGLAEAADVVEATEYMIRLGFVDPKRIAVWGWSFGGFLASKVIELNSGVVTTGIAVAPVTDWRFYDSIYTERYMKTPLMNPKGYETSAIADMAGFKNSEFLLIHGTGDDNVHYQNSLALIWKLTASRVHSYQVQFYPDSDHSMNAGNAFIELFDLLHRFLNERFQMSRTAKRSERFAAHGVIDSGGGDGLEWDLFVNNL
ncbi:hypothetical protein HDU82_006759 [Entophlyctis luteolus]|nr:hypothetical protein HDU82_006759 [Entophlyctis luteolus]